jgi:glycosyltransferase involved in cell wall biosynthesis
MADPPRVHLLGLPHTVTHRRFSHCAFTGKVRRFSPMLQSVGYEVVHYGIAGAESRAKEQVDVLSYEEWRALGGQEPGTEQLGQLARLDSPLYQVFNQRLAPLLRERLAPTDIIALPYGAAHASAVSQFPDVLAVETGIGYPTAWGSFRVYESYAWMHYHLGKEQRAEGSDYWWVIPNYYEPDDSPLGDGSGRYVVYLGRLNRDKGLDIVWEMAKARPDVSFVVCGQGNPAPWLTLPNIQYRPPIHGDGVAELLGRAMCTVMPTRYVEPFGGVAVESMLCGTPVLGSAFGSFTETIRPGRNGYRCRTLQDWLDALQSVESRGATWRAEIRRAAVDAYSLWHLAADYARVFEQLVNLRGAGWYTRRDVPSC